ncbi:hypothetical protein FIBSPDRAFT_968374 [Athelia psychrophila]|uniref:F-box domain-containing protein n=1 Tax=Athelia psychrophila TaxID=1759441 RepID=A0A167UPC7_9AGAM|nr:hypothetical protein FIBSPDRAFT_968374 [Fibularhizoctonia sp. CBS 109695]
MAMPSLLHLELFVTASFIDAQSSPPPLPIILPKIRHLLVEGSDRPYNLSNILRFIHAASLVTLSHSLWYDEKPLPRHFNLELHFPSLKHLILTNVTSDVPELNCHENTLEHNININHIFHTILCGPDDGDRAEENAHNRLLWRKLHSIASSTSRGHFDAARLKGTILKL